MATFTTEQSLPVSFKIVDGRGRPASIEGDPILASSDETVATCSAATQSNGSWLFEVASVSEGEARISVTADADVSEDINNVVGILDVVVVLDARTSARTIELTAGEPVDD